MNPGQLAGISGAKTTIAASTRNVALSADMTEKTISAWLSKRRRPKQTATGINLSWIAGFVMMLDWNESECDIILTGMKGAFSMTFSSQPARKGTVSQKHAVAKLVVISTLLAFLALASMMFAY